MGVSDVADQPAGKAIYELVAEAKRKHDARTEVRFPFFQKASILVDGTRYAAFTREISDSGLGLLQKVQVMPGEIEVAMQTKGRCSIRARVQIIWCEPCGHGWFISGGQFVGSAKLL